MWPFGGSSREPLLVSSPESSAPAPNAAVPSSSSSSRASPSSYQPSSGGGGNDSNITGKFDPTALERGAKAVRELDSSPNSAKAFEVIKLQETTKQKELEKEKEQLNVAKAEIATRRAQVEGEERRKTLDQQHDRERETARYRAQLEAEAYQKKLQDQKVQNEEWLRQQHQQFLEQERVRKQAAEEREGLKLRRLAEQSRLEREAQAERIREEAAMRMKQERENVDVHLRTMRAKFAEERKTKMEQLNAVLSSLTSAGQSLVDDKKKLLTVVGGITGVALGVYGARTGWQVTGKFVESRLGRPPLVRETSRMTFSSLSPFQAIRNVLARRQQQNQQFQEKIVLPSELKERLQWTTNSLVNAKKNGTPFRHLLLYGPPGTGKTLFARTIARSSGLDYAIMTGGDVGPLGKDGVTEMNKLFAWANKSKKGLILFIDEAEAFLRKGRGGGGGGASASSSGDMSEDMRNCLSSFLHHTGTESNKFCVVLATNIRSALDRAVLDRVDEQFEFPLPDQESRLAMLKMFVQEYLKTPTSTGHQITIAPEVDCEEFWRSVAERTENFSGRQLAKMIIGMQAAVFGSGTEVLTKGLADTVVNWKLAHRDEDDWENKGERKISSVSKSSNSDAY